jgi:hypothetical protein
MIVEREHAGEDDSMNLYKLLKKSSDDYLEAEFDQNDKHNI